MNSSRLTIYSDFNAQLLSRILKIKHGVHTDQANGVIGFIPPLLEVNIGDNICLVWITVEGFLKSYKLQYLAHKEKSYAIIGQQIESFADAIESLAKQYSSVFLCSFTEGRQTTHPGIGEYSECGNSFICATLNSSLAMLSFKQRNIHILDTESWKKSCNKPIDDKSWYLTKCGFTAEMLMRAAESITFNIDLLKKGIPCKLILLDLDNTIWGGEVGENGWQGLRLGGHDHIGEAFAEFQDQLLKLTHIGIMIAIISKNEEEIALEAFQRHPEMILRLENICTYRINHLPKHINAIDIAKELNVGLDSAIFIDDNPAERLNMSRYLPEVMIAELPTDPCAYTSYISTLNIFRSIDMTREDISRVQSYRENQTRHETKYTFKSADDWIQTLDTKIRIEPLCKHNITRYVQLLNKTNQYNLRSRRLSLPELEAWINCDSNHAYALNLNDIYGSLGIVSLLSYTVSEQEVFVEDFVVSCRAAGRHIEDTMNHFMKNIAPECNDRQIFFQAIRTKKNQPIITFLETSAYLSQLSNLEFRIDVDSVIPAVAGIELIYKV